MNFCYFSIIVCVIDIIMPSLFPSVDNKDSTTCEPSDASALQSLVIITRSHEGHKLNDSTPLHDTSSNVFGLYSSNI